MGIKCAVKRAACADCLLVRLQDEVIGNNMKMEVTGKLQTHFNTAPKHSNTTAGVSVIMVSA